MKTNLIEIFQTIRAGMQLYEALGFTTRVNSDKKYELWSEKLIGTEGADQSPIFFAAVEILEKHVVLNISPFSKAAKSGGNFDKDLATLFDEISHFEVANLDDLLLEQISDALATALKIYKQQQWV